MKKYSKSELKKTNDFMDITKKHYSDDDLIKGWIKEGFIKPELEQEEKP